MNPNTWTFDGVAGNFDKHINEQLPWYDLFNSLVLSEVARFFIKQDSKVYDLGASTGNVELHLSSILNERNAAFGPLEKHKGMIANYRGESDVIECDITKHVFHPYSFATSILTMTFIHPSDRTSLINKLKCACLAGGAILALEKMENHSGAIGTIQNRITWKAKLDNNVPMEDIVKKEIALSGSQFPLHESELKDFTKIWQFGDFCAWLYIRKE